MAILRRAVGAWCAGTTSVVVTMPTHATGDLLLMFIHTANNAITTAPAGGWALLSPSPVSTGTANTALGVRLTVYWLKATSNAHPSQTVSVTSGTVTNGFTVAYSGVDTTTPFDLTSVSAVAAASTANISCPTLTTATAGAMIVNAVALDNDANSTTLVGTPTNASLASISIARQQTVSTGTGGGVAVLDGIKTTAGLINATTATVTAAARAYLTIALRPSFNYSGTVAISQASTITVTGTKKASGATSVSQASTIAATGTKYDPAGAPVTIGYTTVGSSTNGLTAGVMAGAEVVASQNGTLKSITARLDNFNGVHVKAFLCNASLEIIATTIPFATYSSVGEWLELFFETPPSVTASSTYYLMVMGDTDLGYKYNSVTGTQKLDTTNNYATPTNPTDASTATNLLMSIYATYVNSPDKIVAQVYSFRDGDTNVNSASALWRGETFHVTNAATLKTIQWCLRKQTSPTGSCYAKLYAHTGTFGVDGIPTGTALASVSMDVSTLLTTPTWTSFTLATPYELAANTDYCVVFEYTGGDATNRPQMARDGSTPVDDGNSFYWYLGAYTAETTWSNLYRLIGEADANSKSGSTAITQASTVTVTGLMTSSSGTVAIAQASTVLVTGTKGAKVSAAISQASTVTVTGKEGARGSVAITNASTVTTTGKKGARKPIDILASSTVTNTGKKGGKGLTDLSNASTVTITGLPTGGSGSVAITSASTVTTTGKKGAKGTAVTTQASTVTVTGKEGARGAVVIAQASTITVTGKKGAKRPTDIMVASTVTVTGAKDGGATTVSIMTINRGWW